MGTTYEGMLVMADAAPVCAALSAAGWTAIVAPVGAGRTAVVPREGAYGIAEVDTLGELLSGAGAGFDVLVHSVFDSDLLSLYVYRGGESVHVYHSEMGYLGQPFEDEHGVMKIEFDDVLYDADDPALPIGPRGADPAAFAPFGTGTVDLARLGALLRGENLTEDEQIFAEHRHWSVAESLNLRPSPLTTAYRHTKASDHPEAVLIAAGTSD
ncbi:hypothetical protein [Streptomyces sp. CA-111067]|uniref:hypothetical protein n=1 Tax=Streptomyces sp. CA-111067 TaxID=3240046 RepID=UPI003D9654DF